MKHGSVEDWHGNCAGDNNVVMKIVTLRNFQGMKLKIDKFYQSCRKFKIYHRRQQLNASTVVMVLDCRL